MKQYTPGEERAYTEKTLDELRKQSLKNVEAFQSQKLTPELREYWDRVFKEPDPEPEYDLIQSKQVMRRLLFDHIPDFKYTPENILVIKNFIHWVYFDRDGTDFVLTRGLLLIGNPGSGKTSLMQVFKKYCEKVGRRQFKICYSKEITKAVEEKKDLGIMNEYERGHWCLDELGHEAGVSKIWGNTHNLFGDLLEYRYRRPALITHGTTNIDMDTSQARNLRTVYGDRVYSRLHQMFNIVYLNGKDWRIENH